MNPASRWSRFRESVRDCLGTPSRLPRVWQLVAWLAAALAVACAFFPSDHEVHYAESRGGDERPAVMLVEHALRHVNSVVAIALPV
ncbi:MAG: hypothetical protein ACKPCJ_00805, partial [Betaproteobacteria bacterium]